MNRLLSIALLLLTWPLAGQQLDSTQIRYRDVLVRLRAAIAPIDADVQSLRRDLPTAAPLTLQSKAIRLQHSCREAQQALATHRPAFAATRGNPRQVQARRSLLDAMQGLDRALTEECVRGFPILNGALDADSVRAWAPYRGARIRSAEQTYHEAAAAFASAFRFRIPPIDPGGTW